MHALPPGIQVRPGRRPVGMSAVLLPFTSAGGIDWWALGDHIERTAQAGLVPAVNMDTGYVQLLDADARTRVLEIARERSGGTFAAGAHVPDHPGDAWAPDLYRAQLERIQSHGATPVVFPSHGLNSLDDADWVAAHADLARDCDRFIGFELGPMFVPYGRIYSLEAYRGLMEIRACIGAKHSSLSREREWERLALRDHDRPGFQVLTGNDLAIDMIMYGSDYLLGLSTFAPDAFARRDALWAAGDPSFYELNDLLQYLGQLAFRSPVPAYKHNAAQFLALRGWIDCDATHPDAPQRPESDLKILREIAQRLEPWVGP